MKFSKKISISILAFCLSLMLCTSCNTETGVFPESIEEQVKKGLDRGLDGIIVCVNQAGSIKQYAAGWNNREKQIAADTNSLFKIASISKLYIAAATTKLVVNQSLSLDQSLAELLPDLAGRIENADDITLKMLLQHRSGIPDCLDHPDFPWGNLPISNRDALEFALDKAANFQPDKRYRYSNTNYILIGEILDKTLGYSHHQYIKEEILVPLDLQNTYSLLSEVALEDVMSGYAKNWDSDAKSDDYTLPGGSMVATAADVSIFLRALIDGSLLSPEEQAIYTEVYQYEHTGLLPGYQSIARYHEEIDAVVIQFSNTSGGTAWGKSSRVYNQIIRALEKE
ncbi:MAG: serine hydrolase domain-containing protein [Bacteroidota bacterium]